MEKVVIERHWNCLFIKREVKEKKFETSQTLFTDKLTRTFKGEDLFQDTKVDHWKIESDIARVNQELVDSRRQGLVAE